MHREHTMHCGLHTAQTAYLNAKDFHNNRLAIRKPLGIYLEQLLIPVVFPYILVIMDSLTLDYFN